MCKTIGPNTAQQYIPHSPRSCNLGYDVDRMIQPRSLGGCLLRTRSSQEHSSRTYSSGEFICHSCNCFRSFEVWTTCPTFYSILRCCLRAIDKTEKNPAWTRPESGPGTPRTLTLPGWFPLVGGLGYHKSARSGDSYSGLQKYLHPQNTLVS